MVARRESNFLFKRAEAEKRRFHPDQAKALIRNSSRLESTTSSFSPDDCFANPVPATDRPPCRLELAARYDEIPASAAFRKRSAGGMRKWEKAANVPNRRNFPVRPHVLDRIFARVVLAATWSR